MTDKSLEQLINIFCPECGNTSMFDKNNGFIYCQGCGLELSQASFKKHPPKTYTFEEKIKVFQTEPVHRCIGPRTLITKEVVYNKFSRLRSVQNQLTGTLERNYWKALPIIKKLNNSFPEYTVSKTKRIYMKCAEMGLTRGLGIEPMIGASLYAACRIEKLPWLRFDIMNRLENHLLIMNGYQPTKEYKKLTTGSRLIHQAYTCLLKHGVLNKLQQEIINKGVYDDFRIKKNKFVNYLNTYCSRLNIPPYLIKKLLTLASPLLDKNKEFIKKSVDPAGVIAGLIYSLRKSGSNDLKKIITQRLCKLTDSQYSGITQAAVADYLNVSKVTLRKRYKMMI